MRLLWRNTWIEAPRPHRVPGGALISVEATLPIESLGAAHGRRFEHPARKVASFLVTDGPLATLRKVQAKRAEHAYTGDYALVAVLGTLEEGEAAPQGTRVLALAPRSPRCGDWLVINDSLVREVADDVGPEQLGSFAAGVTARLDEIRPQVGQSFLYSGMEPPVELTAALHDALVGIEPPGSQRGRDLLTPPPGTAGPSETIAVGRARSGRTDVAGLAILGAGDYVRMEVAPRMSGAALRRTVICDREPQIAAMAAAELGFAHATTNAVAAIEQLESRGLVIVATAHDSHATLAAAALEAGHRVFCEKPAVVDTDDLDTLLAASALAPGELEVGFNRRSNVVVERARRRLAQETGPATIIASIREVEIEDDHWYLWPNQGTRVAGNLCHWIDLVVHLLGPGPEPVSVSVSPRVSPAPTGLDADRAFTIEFDDGSTAFLLPTGRGDSTRGVQEQIEIRRGPLTMRVDDLWRMRGLRAGRPFASRTLWRDKAHGRMYRAAVERFEAGQPAAYPAQDLRRVCEAQIALTELLLSDGEGGSIGDLVSASRNRGEAARGKAQSRSAVD